ncbi:MAG: SDR family NAD(P)-dependent oxidoreductase [Pseudomonadales bacterium]
MTGPVNAVVIGASGAIGLALTRALCARAEGGRVFALSRRPRPADEPRAQWIRADATDTDGLAKAAAEVAEHAPSIHRLICCTGMLHDDDAVPPIAPEKALEQLDADAFRRVMTVNALAPLLALTAFRPLLEHDQGSVAGLLSAMVGSIADNRLGGWYSYRMSKAALNMGVKTAAIELERRARRGRRAPIVAAVHPGTTHTPLSERFLRSRDARPAAASAQRILEVLDGLTAADSGGFFNWDGQPLPW